MFRSGKDVVRVGNKKQPPKSYNDDELYSCEYCSEGGWSSETEVEIHKTLLHTKQRWEKLTKTKYVCSICVEDFKHSEELISHIKTEHLYSSKDAYRVEREIFVCDYCDQIFFNKSHLIIHITQRHLNCPEYVKVDCPQCKFKLKHKQVWTHFYKHACQSTSSCRLCFTKFRNRRELRQHLDTKGHYFKCDMCGYYSKKSELFNKHISKNHKLRNGALKREGYKNYFIPRNNVIAAKFKRPSQILMIYRGVVIGNGLKICVLCREICARQREMRHHIMYDHFIPEVMSKNEYKCSCGEIFSSKVLLTHHIFKEKGDHMTFKEKKEEDGDVEEEKYQVNKEECDEVNQDKRDKVYAENDDIVKEETWDDANEEMT